MTTTAIIMRALISPCILATCLARASEAFVFNTNVHDTLDSVAQVSPGTAFRTRLDFDYEDGHSKHQKLALKGPVFELLNEPSKSLPLPTADGFRRNVSTGSKGLKVLEEANFISMQGTQRVQMVKGCWEMTWVDDQKEGQFVCAFHLPMPIHRSGVSITNGDLYLNFRVYTQESLSAGLEMKRRVLGQNADAVKEKDEHLEKMNATGNLIMKAIHYRNAFAAFEKVLYAPQAYSFPEYGEAIQLPNGLLVVGEGSINRKGNALLGPSWTKIGTVTLAPYTVVDDKLSKLKP